jgi:hypothetical protein
MPDAVVTIFGYEHQDNSQDSLPQLAAKVRAAHQAMREATRVTLRAVLDAGDALTAAKPQVPEGEWRRWLRANCFLSVRTAELYRQLAANREQIETELERVTDLSLRAARRLITKRTTTAREPAAVFHSLTEAWAAASRKERQQLLDRVGRAGLCDILSPGLKAEIVDAVLGLEINGAASSSKLAIGLTRVLKVALSSTHDGERLAALGRLAHQLQANGRSLHDVVVALAKQQKRAAA